MATAKAFQTAVCIEVWVKYCRYPENLTSMRSAGQALAEAVSERIVFWKVL
jgi:hypothetical protein